jgi:hypothetical protein
MSFWEDQMPKGMLVRSAWSASNLSDPSGRFSLSAYEEEQSRPFPRPLPGEEMSRYARWFQALAVPDLDERLISTIERGDSGFVLRTEDGERIVAGRVVIATGLHSFPFSPPQFAGLGEGLATHSMRVPEPARFADQSVVVIGSGQSAVETAALVCEAGAKVELIARAPAIRWLARGEKVRTIDPLLQRLLYAPTDVGPAGVSRLVATPNLFRRLPRNLQDRLAYRSIRPAATSWLMDRSTEVTMTFNREVIDARPLGSGARLRLDKGSERDVDHVILATGYKIDVARESVIGEALRSEVQLHQGYPVLRGGFESSVPALHFVGAYSAWSFGPVMRFVAGTDFTARTIAKHVELTHQRGYPPPEEPPAIDRSPQTAARD